MNGAVGDDELACTGVTRRVTLGDRAFPVAAARAWNSLPAQIRAAAIVFFKSDIISLQYVVDNCFRKIFNIKLKETVYERV